MIDIGALPQPTRITVHLQEAEPPSFQKHPSVHRIVGVVCERYKLTRTDILSERRTYNIVRPRQVAMYLAKRLTLRSLPEIGRYIGGRDHTTVLHGIRKIATLRANSADLDAEITEIESILGRAG